MDLAKNILIQESPPTAQQARRLRCEKEKKLRVEAKTWDLATDELSHTFQFTVLQNIYAHYIDHEPLHKTRHSTMFVGHIKAKISSYKHQDVVKNKYDPDSIVGFLDVLELVKSCDLKCHYCSREIYILYPHIREATQWSLDRVNNDMGHNVGNLVVACLECNLKRRRTNKDAFMFTKNMKIVKTL